MSDDVRAVYQQGVLDEQLVAVSELGAEGAAQQSEPQLPLQLDGGGLLVLRVQGSQRGSVEGMRGAGRPQASDDLAGSRRYASSDRQDAF